MIACGMTGHVAGRPRKDPNAAKAAELATSAESADGPRARIQTGLAHHSPALLNSACNSVGLELTTVVHSELCHIKTRPLLFLPHWKHWPIAASTAVLPAIVGQPWP